MAKFLTEPDPAETGWPKGVKYIIGNEGCERFSFYGMKGILQVHLAGLFALTMLAQNAEQHAQHVYHIFVAGVYAFPMIGALLADRLFGKYKTILWLSLVYCAGHAVLAMAEVDAVRETLGEIPTIYLGLGLIAVGSGGIKPCVSAHVGDQFGKSNWHLVDKIYQAFYFIINFGSFFATLLIPWLKAEYGASVAFGVPGVLMFIATIFFWRGRHEFVHVQPSPGGKLGILDALGSSMLFMGFIGLPMFFPELMGWTYVFIAMAVSIAGGLGIFFYRQTIKTDDGFLAVVIEGFFGKKSKEQSLAVKNDRESLAKHWFFAKPVKRYGVEAAEGSLAVMRIVRVFLMVSVFWALFDQHGSSWIRQAKMMDLTWDVGFKVFHLLPSQIQSLNPLMVMALIPLNLLVIYPILNKVFKLSPLRKMTIGMMVAATAFVAVALIQGAIDAAALNGEKITVAWQILPFLIITQAEVMVSITGLEFAYTQAPKRMKSTVMGFWMLCVALGNKLTSLLSEIDMSLEDFFWLFAGLMAIAAVIFGIAARFYHGRTYAQGE